MAKAVIPKFVSFNTNQNFCQPVLRIEKCTRGRKGPTKPFFYDRDRDLSFHDDASAEEKLVELAAGSGLVTVVTVG